MTGFLLLAFIFLIAGVIAVPIASRLGLGSVLGYLIAGIALGPLIGALGGRCGRDCSGWVDYRSWARSPA